MRRALVTAVAAIAIIVVTMGAIWRWTSDGSGRYHYRYELRPNATSEANPDLKRTLGSNPSPFALVEMASLNLAEAKRTDDPTALATAKQLIQQAQEKLPTAPGAKMVLAGIADMTHHFDDTLKLARDSYQENGSIGAAMLISTASLARGDVDEAIRWADLAVRRRPLSATYFVRALALAARGRDVEATFDFDRVIALEGDGDRMEAARVRAIWGRIRLRQGNRRDARSLAREALRIAPSSVPALALQGELALANDDTTLATESYREAFKLSRRPRFLALSARALAQAGRHADAERARSEAEKLMRRDMETETGHRLDLIETLLDRNDRQAAQEALALLKVEQTVRRSPDVFIALARAEELAGRGDAALSAAHAALSAGFPDTTVYAHLVRLERVAGNPSRALIYANLAGEAKAPMEPKPAAGAR